MPTARASIMKQQARQPRPAAGTPSVDHPEAHNQQHQAAPHDGQDATVPHETGRLQKISMRGRIAVRRKRVRRANARGRQEPREQRQVMTIAWGGIAPGKVDVAPALNSWQQQGNQQVTYGKIRVAPRVVHGALHEGRVGLSPRRAIVAHQARAAGRFDWRQARSPRG
jgi:hypothetical protein